MLAEQMFMRLCYLPQFNQLLRSETSFHLNFNLLLTVGHPHIDILILYNRVLFHLIDFKFII